MIFLILYFLKCHYFRSLIFRILLIFLILPVFLIFPFLQYRQVPAYSRYLRLGTCFASTPTLKLEATRFYQLSSQSAVLA